jgi:predicted RNase H-like HicB family nuclease
MTEPKVRSVIPLPAKHLLVSFSNCIHKVYDCNPLLQLDQFRLLTDETVFRTVTVDVGGCGISWDDQADLSEVELWHNGVEISIEPDEEVGGYIISCSITPGCYSQGETRAQALENMCEVLFLCLEDKLTQG